MAGSRQARPRWQQAGRKWQNEIPRCMRVQVVRETKEASIKCRNKIHPAGSNLLQETAGICREYPESESVPMKNDPPGRNSSPRGFPGGRMNLPGAS